MSVLCESKCFWVHRPAAYELGPRSLQPVFERSPRNHCQVAARDAGPDEGVVFRADLVLLRRFSEFPRVPRPPGVEINCVQPAVSPSSGKINAAPDGRIITVFIRRGGIQHYKTDLSIGVSDPPVELISVFAVGGYYGFLVHSRVFLRTARRNPNRNQRTLISTNSAPRPPDSPDRLCHAIRRERGSPIS